MDIFDKNKRSAIMGAIKGKNTKPEIRLRKALFAKGYRYRIHYKKLPGSPDIVLPRYKTAILLHGCFWHGHDCISKLPKTNTEFWKKKIERNRTRDNQQEEMLRNLGWKIIKIWECEIKTKDKLDEVVKNITERLETQ